MERLSNKREKKIDCEKRYYTFLKKSIVNGKGFERMILLPLGKKPNRLGR